MPCTKINFTEVKSKKIGRDIPYKNQCKEICSARLRSKKIDFRANKIIRNKKEYYIMVKQIQLEHIIILNIYAPKLTLKIHEIKRDKFDKFTVVVGNFNTPISVSDRIL